MESGPPIALVHGWGGSFRGTFANFGWIEAFAEVGRQVIPVDLPGHGVPTASHDLADYDEIATAVDAQLPHSDGPLDILGFSLGGKAALELGCRNPDRFRRIAACGVGDGAFTQTGASLAAILEAGFTAEDRARMPLISAYVDESDSDLLALAAVLRRPEVLIASEERLATIRSEIALINGDQDNIAHPDGRLRAALPDVRYISLPGVDHFRMHHQRSFIDAALAFFTR